MKNIYLLLVPLFLFSLLGYSQNTLEVLKKNKVKHLTITKWVKEKDGTEKRSGDMIRIEQDYDPNGNLIDRVVFISFRETKTERITYKYDDQNRSSETILYRFNDNNPDGYIVEKRVREYDEMDNVIFYSLHQGTDNNPKIECEYSYNYLNTTEKLIEKLTKCTNSKGVPPLFMHRNTHISLKSKSCIY